MRVRSELSEDRARRVLCAMITLVDAADPPLRLALGTVTLAAIAAKNAYVAQETQVWKSVVVIN